ncbi:zinc transporter ZntB [Nisaea acidiphila]|uniref:Zinc transporter ZntB n=1 Tax=Nisaea acidiphila TaxID=1862145 RepID=A0A9J7AS36_9PROT|nr:zinc transporter ZntB [Nisaea acidiphila]UUX49369.1 zinc transporter ZntB [Nisaea acidiphila]
MNTVDGEDGLIAGIGLPDEGAPSELDWDSLATGRPGGFRLCWLHLDQKEERARDWIRSQAGIPDVAADALVAEETRPRVQRFDNGLLIVLRGVNLNPGANPEDMVSLRIWVERGLMISVRLRRLLAVQDTLAALREGDAPADSDELLAKLADRLFRRMEPVIDDLEERIDLVDEEQTAGSLRQPTNELQQLRLRTIILRRYILPQRDALHQLTNDPPAWFTRRTVSGLREAADRVIRYVESLDEIRERAMVIQDTIQNRNSEELNRRLYLLSIISAICLPLGLLTGLLGINVAGMPGSDTAWAFWAVSGLMIVIVALEIWALKSLKWFR